MVQFNGVDRLSQARGFGPERRPRTDLQPRTSTFVRETRALRALMPAIPVSSPVK